ncbi:type IV toxin-antitoxin system AbiEi family antitoxin domain-containing protein [Mariniluteicoccus flavus]
MSGLAIVRELAAGQWGMVTAQQAAAVGVSRQSLFRWVTQGALGLAGHGLYRVSDAPETAHEELKAAWLHLDRGRLAWDRIDGEQVEVVSHEAAAVVHDLGTVSADQAVFTTARRRQSRDPRVRFHRGEVPERDQMLVDGLPVTTPARTLIDLVGRGKGWDETHLAEVARDVVVEHRVRPAAIAVRLDPVADRFGASSGQELLERWLQDSGANDELIGLLPAPALRSAVESALADLTLAHAVPQLNRVPQGRHHEETGGGDGGEA